MTTLAQPLHQPRAILPVDAGPAPRPDPASGEPISVGARVAIRLNIAGAVATMPGTVASIVDAWPWSRGRKYPHLIEEPAYAVRLDDGTLAECVFAGQIEAAHV